MQWEGKDSGTSAVHPITRGQSFVVKGNRLGLRNLGSYVNSEVC